MTTDYSIDKNLPMWRVWRSNDNSTVAECMTYAEARKYIDTQTTRDNLIPWPMPNVGPLPPWWFRATQPPRISAEEREELSPDVGAWQRARDAQSPYGKRKAQKWGALK